MPDEITLSQLEAEAQQAERTLAAAREALKAKRLELCNNSDHQLAAQLHQLMCRASVCAWDFEMIDGAPDWNAAEHAAWLSFAQQMQTVCAQMGGTPAQILQVLAWVEQSRP